MPEPAHLITDRSYIAPLEGWRGLLAMCVVTLHFSKLFFSTELTPWGYLAVDFFFILSGFIIAFTYEAGIATGRVDFRKFAGRRIARLWPLYIISIGVYLLVYHTMVLPHQKYDTTLVFGIGPTLVAQVVLQVTMLAVLMTMPQPNGPVWSVQVEWFVNLCFFALLSHFRRIPNFLLCMMVIVGSGYLLAVSPHGLDTPSQQVPIVRGFVGFSLGWLIFRFHQRLPDVSWFLLVPFEIALCGAIIVLLQMHDYPFVISDDYIFQLIVFPLIIILCLYRKSVIGWIFSLWQFRFLGRISYSVYLLHYPLAFYMSNNEHMRSIGMFWLGGYYFMALLIIASLSYALIETPGRWLGRKLVG